MSDKTELEKTVRQENIKGYVTPSDALSELDDSMFTPPHHKQKVYGALEAGGTKMVCALGDAGGRILEQRSIPTTTPEETMPRIIEYFADKEIAALGIGCFGPIDVHRDSPDWGMILSSGIEYIKKAPWVSLWPGVAIVWTVLGFNLTAEGIRELLDPRMKV